MANWMLVSHDWLKIVLSVVFRDLWITSLAHIKYIVRMSRPSNTSFICELAGITIHEHASAPHPNLPFPHYLCVSQL
jgi:hypothetical protein